MEDYDTKQGMFSAMFGEFCLSYHVCTYKRVCKCGHTVSHPILHTQIKVLDKYEQIFCL